MRTKTITPHGPLITATYPLRLKNLKHSINTGINRIRINAEPEERLHYKISTGKNGGFTVSVREKGLSNWFRSLSPKNRVQQPVLKEELEHSLIGNEFTPTFLNLKETFKNKAKKPLPFPEKVDYLS